jgi:hypothetical protein
MASKTRKNVPWRNWKNQKPSFHQKTMMMKKCGKKCFLGPRKSFPICSKNTCKVNPRGVYAAYVRAREYSSIRGTRKYRNISSKAKKMLKNMGLFKGTN